MPISLSTLKPKMGDKPEGRRGLCRTVMRFLFSHIGLCLLVAGYSALGAWMFYAIEGPSELRKAEDGIVRAAELETYRAGMGLTINNWQQCFLKEEAVTQKLMADNKAANITMSQLDILLHMNTRKCRNDQVEELIKDLLDTYHSNISSAISELGYDGTVPETPYVKWTFSSALVFTVTTITLIGYGHISPTGEVGRFILILYSLLGIPLTLMFLANIGKLFAAAIRFSYGRGCCFLCYRDRMRHTDDYVLNEKGEFSHRRGDPEPEGFRPVRKPKREAELIREYNELAAASGNVHYNPNEMSGSEYMNGVLAEDEATDILRDGDQPVPIALTIGIILTYVALGAVMFSAWEGWSFITATYFSFVTLTTMGFGDLVPGFSDNSAVGQIKLFAAALYIVLGLAVLSMGFDLIISEIVAKAKSVGKLTGIVEVVDADGDGVDDDLQEGNIGKTRNRFKRHRVPFQENPKPHDRHLNV